MSAARQPVHALVPDERLRSRERAENFPVALRFLPATTRHHLRAVYDVARLVDDVGDEVAGDRLALLDALDRDLDRIWTGGLPEHAVVRRLAPTVGSCRLPAEPFHQLVEANRRDVQGWRCVTREDLLDYCALSAAPVGRLVLGIAGVTDSRATRASDAICAGLQLVEHWQDVAEDVARGRVYLPEADRQAHGVTVTDLQAPRASPAVRRLLADEADWARSLLAAGPPLVRSLRGWVRVAVAGYVAGGLAALDALGRVRFDVLGRRAIARRRDVLRHAVVLLTRRW